MALEPPFSVLRTAALKSVLVMAFKSLPARVKQAMDGNGWNSWNDFMEAVARGGQVYLHAMAPNPRRVEEHGVEAELRRLRGLANTEAMLKLLALTFYGEPDEVAAFEALKPYGIITWHDMSMKTLQMAVAKSRRNHWDGVKAPTLVFATLQDDPTPERVSQVVEAFGLLSPKHFEALLESFYNGEITIEDLDRSVNNHMLLTEFANRAPSNPHKGLVFGRHSDGTMMRGASLGAAERRSYTEELVAQGLTALRTTEEVKEAFRTFGVPNVVIREDGDVRAAFIPGHPDAATVYVNDHEDGRWVAVDARPRPTPRLAGAPDPSHDYVMLRDLDSRADRPGSFVAARAEDWAGDRPVIEGWRGPTLDSEEFARTRLVPAECANVLVDLAGFFDCIPPGIKVL